jgi:hypothetical protein
MVTVATQVYNARALIWLHMAEACIAAHSQRLAGESASSNKGNVARDIVRGPAFTYALHFVTAL